MRTAPNNDILAARAISYPVFALFFIWFIISLIEGLWEPCVGQSLYFL
jgi:hypothetical protein